MFMGASGFLADQGEALDRISRKGWLSPKPAFGWLQKKIRHYRTSHLLIFLVI
jgi:hypothetical protein